MDNKKVPVGKHDITIPVISKSKDVYEKVRKAEQLRYYLQNKNTKVNKSEKI